MSTTHLGPGSVEPPRIEGLLRLYSMVYCPYAHRPRLVLKHKGVPHDIVNINLAHKPEWYLKLHPQGKVPSLLINNEIVIESLDISDLLDEKYPERPLYPADPEAKKRDKELIGKIASFTASFAGWIFKDELTPEQVVEALVGALQPFDDELAKRGTIFFGGDEPGMVDYMLWPWIERAGVLPLKLKTKLPFQDDHVPTIHKWKKSMIEHPVVASIYITPEKYWKFFQHRITGSEEPPRVDGLLRLFSMKFCPFAQRARLVVKAKGIPHDIVNIDLSNKPEWYIKIHPEGKVPALLDGDKVVVESLDIADYLDEKVPENPLYPAEPEAKRQDKELIQKIGSVVGVFNKCVFGVEEKTPKEWLDDFREYLQPFEDELAKRETVFFGGDKPGMVDYMLWPWAERAGVVPIKLGAKLPIQDDQLSRLRKWRKAMREDPVCAEIYNGPEKFWKIVEFRLKGTPADYDSI